MFKHFPTVKWFGGVIIDVIFIGAIFPNMFSVAVHWSAVNSLEQEELELNALWMNCLYVIRSTLTGQILSWLLAFDRGSEQQKLLFYLSFRQFLHSCLLTLLKIPLQNLFKSADDAVHISIC